MDRIFLDANVLFSAAYIPRSRLLWLWARRGCRLLTSDYAVEEATRNLAGLGADCLDRLTQLMQRVEVVTFSQILESGKQSWNVTLPEKDQPILAAAVRSQATHLLTGDKKHFGKYFGQVICGVKIETPAQYYASASKKQ